MTIILAILFGISASVTCVQAAPAEKITYDDHVRPIFRQHCLSCHSADTKKSDLALDAYPTLIEGGASGEVVFAGDLDSSRLWDLVSHQDEPSMPPDADKLPDDKLDLIRRWIEGGLLENSGSVANLEKKPGLAMLSPVNLGKPDGPAAMPAGLYREPIVYSTRAAAVTSLAASPWAPVIAVAGQRQISLYHSESTELLGVLPFLEGVPQVLAFSRDGSRLLAAGGRGASLGLAALYDVESGSRLLTVGDEYDAVLAADINAQQTLVALGGPLKVVRVFHAADNSLAFEIRKHTDWITAIAFSPDGELLLTADRNGGTLLWEADTGREVASLRGHTGAVTSAAWRADSQIVATAGADGSIRLWNRKEGTQAKTWTAHGGGATSVSFAADGRLVTAGRDRVVKVWNTDGGHIKDLATFGDIALAACTTHDGRRVAAGDFLGEVRLLDIESGEQISQLAPNPITLAMRMAAATNQVGLVTQALELATAAKQAADDALVAAQTEGGKRAATLTEAQRKLSEAQAARELTAKEVETKQQSAGASAEQVKQATAALTQAAAAVAAAEAELSQAREAKAETAAAEEKLIAATEQTKQTIATIETAQASLKQATEAVKSATNKVAAKNAVVATLEKSVQAAQSAVDQFATQMATAQESVEAKGQELTKQQAAVVAAAQAVEAVKAEQSVFATAMEQYKTAIGLAEAKIGTEAEQLAAAIQQKEQAADELAAHQSAADEAAKKLAEVKAEYLRLKKVVDEAHAKENQKIQAASDAQLAHLRAIAAAEHAVADRAMFEKAAEIRAKYNK